MFLFGVSERDVLQVRAWGKCLPQHRSVRACSILPKLWRVRIPMYTRLPGQAFQNLK